jgi:hypothetical protein
MLIKYYYYYYYYYYYSLDGIAVAIATRYELHVLLTDSRWGEPFRTHLERSWCPPCFSYNGHLTKAYVNWRCNFNHP